jgi:ABC-type uncharacterized transport system auxiliary subunit
MRSIYRLFILIVLVLGIVSCSRKAIIRKYYLLEASATSGPAELNVERPYEFKVVVKDFHVAKAFEQTRIALRSATHELNYYFYHHWAVRPSAAISEFVYYLVDHAGLFDRCSRGYAVDADFVIIGEIHALERLRTQKTEEAHLNITFRLSDAKDDRSLITYEADRRATFEEKSMNAFAGQMSRLLKEETEAFILKVTEFFKTYK